MSNLYLKAGGGGADPGWIRPTDWLPIPTIASGEEVFYMLSQVNNVADGNFEAFSFTGNYKVDWGDGNIENFASNVQANHSYNWADVGNVTSEGYRQALIKVTPQAGQHLTAFDFQKFYPGTSNQTSSNFLDIVYSAPYLADGQGSAGFYRGGVYRYHNYCQRVWILDKGFCTNMYAAFYTYFRNLEKVILPDMSDVTDANFMFQKCSSLKLIDLFDTSGLTTAEQMFQGCYSLSSVPDFDFSNVITCSSMFSSSGIKHFSSNTLTIATGLSNLFASCSNINRISLNIPLATNLNNLATNAYSLQELEINGGNLLNLQTSFSFCNALKKVTLTGTQNVTDMYGLFYQNSSIREIVVDATSVGNAALFADDAFCLEKLIMTGLKVGTSLKNTLLSAQALNDFFTSLGTATGSQTITITGSYGAATCDTTIATAKGFTVVI